MISATPAAPATAASNDTYSRYAWKKLAWPLLLACGFLVFVSASSIYLVVSSQSSQELMNRALQLENRLWETLAVVRIAESEQRGFLLTGDPAYLEVYHNTIDAGEVAVANLRSVTADDPALQHVVDEIEPLLQRKFAELQETMRLHDAGDHAAALDLVRTGVGRDLMTRIRVATSRLMDEQRHLASLRTSNSVSTNIWLLLGNLAGLTLILLLVVIWVLAIRRYASVRKDAEKHLEQMEARYHRLLEAAPDTMVVVNHAGKIVLLNLQAEKEFGYRRDELLGQNIKKIIPNPVAERLIDNGSVSSRDMSTLQIGTEIQLTGRRKDGGEFPIEIMLSPLESAERILVIRDISARRQTERLKDEFVATVSHELRTPLTSISGSLGLLKGRWASQLPESAARLLTIAHTNSQRLARLLNDILDIEKLESGRVVFNLSKVAVRSLVEHAIEDNRGFAESYGVSVRLDGAPVDFDVNADPDRLAQVITNLLSNAIKFSLADGEVLVAVGKNADEVRITVRDHGAGVPVEFKPLIFEKFAQADATNTRQKGGTGLGLSIVKQIVERLGGKIGFDDAAGGGAIFYVDLPAWDGRAGGEIDLDSDAAATRILFCEDDRAGAAMVREQLRPAGFAVDFAHTVAAAVARTDATRYAAVLVDLQLPDGDGVGLIVRLRAQAQYRDVPIVVIAGDPDQGRSDVRSSRLNVLRWFGKPIDPEALMHLLKIAIAAPPRQRPRILHVDDDYDVLALVNHELRSIADVVSADSVESARRTLATDRIDLAVLDIALGEDCGLDLLADLRDSLGNAIPVIIFSTHGADMACDEQVHAALSKTNSSLEILGEAVRDRLVLLPT